MPLETASSYPEPADRPDHPSIEGDLARNYALLLIGMPQITAPSQPVTMGRISPWGATRPLKTGEEQLVSEMEPL